MKTIDLPGGFKTLEDNCIGKWQKEVGKLDHDAFLPTVACANIPVGGIAIDCGAFVGDHTIAYSRKVGPLGMVMAIEAGKDAYDCLVHNAGRFESPVLCVPAALSDEDNEDVVHNSNKDNAGASKVSRIKHGPIVDVPNTKTVRLDSLCESFTRLDFIKIDCEGWEYKILKGGEKAIKKFHPVMLIEMNREALKEQLSNDVMIYELLLSWNYEWRIVQPECNGSSAQFDILCCYKEPNLIVEPPKNIIHLPK